MTTIQLIKETADGETWFFTEVAGNVKFNSCSKSEAQARNNYKRIKEGLRLGRVIEILESEKIE